MFLYYFSFQNSDGLRKFEVQKVEEAGKLNLFSDLKEYTTHALSNRSDAKLTMIEPRITFDHIWIDYLKMKIERYSECDDKFKVDHYLYTDGSKRKKGIGCAFVLFERNDSNDSRSYEMISSGQYTLEPLNSIFNAELFAIHQGLHWIKNNMKDKIRNLLILTDSKLAIKEFTNMRVSENLIGFFTRKLMRDCSYFPINIKIGKVKAHSGEYGNDLVDQMAKEIATLREDDSVNPENNIYDYMFADYEKSLKLISKNKNPKKVKKVKKSK